MLGVSMANYWSPTQGQRLGQLDIAVVDLPVGQAKLGRRMDSGPTTADSRVVFWSGR
jgi:hypothetical protein